ncbi:ngoBIM, partial [Symbiodinium sp. CCMP2592]
MVVSNIDAFQLDWDRLLSVAKQLSPVMEGQTVNILAAPFQEPVFQADRVMIRALVALGDDEAPETATAKKVVLLLRRADWEAVSDCTGPLRIIQARLVMQQSEYILDCLGIDSVVVSSCVLHRGTSLEIAEFFCGGFSGWSQAAYILHRHGFPVHLAWTIDVDPACSEMLRYQHESWQEISQLSELHDASCQGVTHVCADITTNWWLRMFQKKPVNLVCVSAPCQPWSSAGSEQGLESLDGQLLLRAADILGSFRVPVVLLEQVANFPLHPHFAAVMQAWSRAGYRIAWQASLNLLDVLPGQRVRFLLVLLHSTHTGNKLLNMGAWTTGRRINLGQAKAIFALPPPLRQANTPSAEVLAVYMDPWYVPAPRSPHLRPQSPSKFRLRSACDSAGVFVAQYQFQHELAPAQMEKGILACLLRQGDTIRFFAGPEIASIHGAVRPIFLSVDQRQQMRLLGNAISVPQAMVPLVHACCHLGLTGAPEPAEAVAWCLQARLHNGNSVLMPFGPNWVLCHSSQTAEVLRVHAVHSPETLHADPPEAFTEVCLNVQETTYALCVPPDVGIGDLLYFFGCPDAAASYQGPVCAGPARLPVQVSRLPELNCNGAIGGSGSASGLALLLTDFQLFVVELHTARSWSQLLCVFRAAAPGSESLVLFSTTGQRLLHAADFQTCMIAVAEDEDFPIQALSSLVPYLHGLQLHRHANEVTLEVAAEVAAQVWFCMPFHLLYAFGWSSSEENFPPVEQAPSVFRMAPCRSVAMPRDLFVEQWRWWLVVARLESLANSTHTGRVDVEVQVVARRLWVGQLPAGTPLQTFTDIWNIASAICNLLPGHRIFSGPHPHVPTATLGEIHATPAARVVRRTGHLLITVHPELRGGGAKSDDLSWAQTRTASECLAQGIDLTRTTQFVDQLSAAVGAQRLSQTLQDCGSTTKWQALVDLAETAKVPAPVPSNLPAKASLRAGKAMQRRKAQDRRQVRAQEVCLTQDFFVNDDGSPASILTMIQPGASGLQLVDEPEAVALLQTLRGVQPDELGLLVLGHSCPCPDECSGALCFPAISKANGSKLLLAGCLHNVGGKRIRQKDSGDVTVELPELNCCTFDCYADEFDAPTWQQIVQAPVRAVAEAFKKGGMAKPFADPWGRHFVQAGRPAVASMAERVSFNARVPADQLDQLLILSGHNNVYVTPRKMDKSVVQAYSIVWLGACRAEALRASLQVQGQLGIARAKNKYGLRVPAARFPAVFAALKPGQIIPNKIAVNQLYRIGPLPQEVGSEAITGWATKAGWQIRVIKSLGATHWLVGAAAAPPTVCPAFNGQTILISPVGQKQDAPPIVQSGSVPHRPARPVVAQESLAKGEDPWLFSDPWSKAVAHSSHGTGLPSHPSTSSFGSLATPSRSLAGPTESRFQAQDTRLLALEEGLENLRLRQEAQHGELVQRQSEDRDFEELKSLMMSCRDSRDPSKKAKKQGDEDLCPAQCNRSVANVDHDKLFSWEPLSYRWGCGINVVLPSLRGSARLSRYVTGRGFRFGEALHPGPSIPSAAPHTFTGAALHRPEMAPRPRAFLCPSVPQLPQEQLPPTRVHSHLRGGRPRPQRKLPSFFQPHQPVLPTSPQPTVASSDDTSTARESPCDLPSWHLSVVNPTSILNKESSLLALQSHVFLLSETSAVSRAQDIVTGRLRPTGLSWVWGTPVPEHRHENAHQPSLRGCAAGVALASVFPVRPPFAPLCSPAEQAHRLVLGHIRLGPLHARVLVLYGWPANHAAAAAKNEELFREALKLISASEMPTLVGGDFNVDVKSLPVWCDFVRAGYAELFDFHHLRFGQRLPPTCRDSTRNDTVLLPRVFQQLFQTAKVDTACHLFDSHAPLTLTFLLPQQNPCQTLWRKPDSWMQFEPDAQVVETHYGHCRQGLAQLFQECSSRDDLEAIFSTWASDVESAVSQAIRDAHFQDPLRCPSKELPRRCQGRCVYREVKSKALPTAAPGARPGDYRPPDEALSFRSRHKVKQVRRLQSFCRRLARFRLSSQLAPTPGCLPQPAAFSLWQEWEAIAQAHGYPPNFRQWLLQIAHFEVFYEVPLPAPPQGNLVQLAIFPPADWLADVLAFVKFECEAVIGQEHQARQQFHRYRTQQDSANGLRAGYRSVRPPDKPAFTSVPVAEAQQAVLQCCAPGGWGLYRVTAPDFIRPNCPAKADDCPAETGALHNDEIFGPRIWVRVPSRPYLENFILRQDTDASTARELHRCFIDYWHPIWNRDTGEARSDLQRWSTFIESLPPCPEAASQLELALEDLSFWRQHLRRLKPHSATGYCGFSNQELKWLPDAPLQDLASIFQLCAKYGWPRHLARATVSTLAKIPLPMGMKHGRPITIFANLWRLWASGVATAVLRQWATWLPSGVMGSIPGRSVRDLSLSLELQVEQSLLSGDAFAGFSIDVIKCFNQLPRLPLRFLLGHLQIPETVLEPWFDFLDSCHRLPVFHKCLGPPVLSTTGMPEGCPLSVLAQVAVCWAAQSRQSVFGAEMVSYVDNLTWTGRDQLAMAESITDAQAFCLSLKLPIDWTKSFAWATCSKLRRWLTGPAQSLIPQGCQLTIVHYAKDLGIAFKFRRNNALNSARHRLEEGHRRLRALRNPAIPLFDKARILQTSVWPATLYGLESRLLSEDEVSKLRTGGCEALLGPRRSANPTLALSALTPRVSDPEVYLLCQALLALQRMLCLQPLLGMEWLRLTVHHLHQPGRVFGPATALAGLLVRNGWCLRADGNLAGPGNAKVHLLRDRPKVLRRAVKVAWLAQVPSKVQGRNGMLFAGVPAPCITEKVLLRFGPGMQIHLAQTMVGGFLSNAAKSTWDPLQSSSCVLCGMVDHKRHRILECPVAAPLRQLYQPLLDWIEQDQPHWFHCPFPVALDAEDFLRLFWHSRKLVPPPVLPHLCLEGLTTAHLFTDGACSRPNLPAARHAAWAVVLYTGSACMTLRETGFFWCQHAQIPPGWHVVAQGVVPGCQDINRAEYCALVQALMVVRALPVADVVIWTDSKNAQRAVSPPGPQGVSPGRWHFASDLVPDDLPHLLAGVSVRKVKSHQDLHQLLQSAADEDLLPALGNAIVDAAAKQALCDDLELAHDQCQQIADWHQQQASFFDMYCRYLAELTKIVVPAKRSQLLLTSTVEMEAPACHDSWCLLQPPLHRCPTTVTWPREAVRAVSSWPDWYTVALGGWIEQLCWPSSLPEDTDFAGITYHELLVNFVVTTAVLPPVRLHSTGASEWVSLLRPAGILLPAVLRELIVHFVSSVGMLSKKCGCALWPSPRHHRLRTLELCGSTNVGKKGLLYRPRMPNLSSTLKVLLDIAQSNRPGECLREAAWRIE